MALPTAQRERAGRWRRQGRRERGRNEGEPPAVASLAAATAMLSVGPAAVGRKERKGREE